MAIVYVPCKSQPFSGVGKHIDFKFDIHKDESAEIVSNLVANKLVQQAQAEEIQLLLEKVIERVKETPAGNIQVLWNNSKIEKEPWKLEKAFLSSF